MKLLSAEQMRALDRYSIEEVGIPSLELMERAGAAVADAVLGLLYGEEGLVIVLCGKGNNGGDGLVTARVLQESGLSVQVVLPFDLAELSSDAAEMYQRARQESVPMTDNVSEEALRDATAVVDALLGTGVTGAPRGVIAELINRLNGARNGHNVVAVDLPSGVETDTGQIYGPAVKASLTVTLAQPKPALVLYPGAWLAGKWIVADIGFPPELVARWPAVAQLTSRLRAMGWVPRRPPTAHKRMVGWALLVAGSFGMTGAAAMAANAAYRAGAGLVRLALPASLTPALNATLTEVVFRPQPETPRGTLSYHAVAPLLREAEEVQAVLIGPGLSRNAATANAIRRVVAHCPAPLVVDADALTAMAGHDALWKERSAPTVITPHPGEMARLLGQTVNELERDRLGTAKRAAELCNAVVVFKGSPTVIAGPDGACFVNPTGNAGLAVAGTGDVLSGAITALLAQGLAPLQAATLAAYLGGMAAERLAAEMGINGQTALDLIDMLPFAIADLQHEPRPHVDE